MGSNRANHSKSQAAKPIVALDLFCGAGGLTRGLLDAGIEAAAGYDLDPACQHPHEHNKQPVQFQNQSAAKLTRRELSQWHPKGSCRLLVGCAPCRRSPNSPRARTLRQMRNDHGSTR